MNPFYYSPTDPRGPWIYVPAWPESAPKNADNYSGIERDRYKQAKAKALAAGIGMRHDGSMTLMITARDILFKLSYGMDGRNGWQPYPDKVYWLPLEVYMDLESNYKLARILPNKEEPKPEEKKEAESGHRIHESVKNDPIAYFASTDDLLKYDHFYRNGLADRLPNPALVREEGAPEVSPRVAALVLQIRDALALKDQNLAYHLLYQIACPVFDSVDPWFNLKQIAKDVDRLNQWENPQNYSAFGAERINECEPSEAFLGHYSIERHHAGYCVRNPKGQYLWFGSDDGEEPEYFFTEGRRTRTDEDSKTRTCYSSNYAGAVVDLKKWTNQELQDDETIPPTEVYPIKIPKPSAPAACDNNCGNSLCKNGCVFLPF